jgi:hypothetical protein
MTRYVFPGANRGPTRGLTAVGTPSATTTVKYRLIQVVRFCDMFWLVEFVSA